MSAPVALVGAGPGDPDLLTVRAEAVLAAAAVVVTDAAVQRLAHRFAAGADVVAVPDGEPAVAALLAAAAARRDGSVARLYAGDPWLHPAHADELAALRRAGIGAEAVPGVALEVAVPAQAGIAVHVRHLAVVCTIGPSEAVPPPTDPGRTLVVTCSDGAAAARRLVAAGGRADLPAAILQVDGSAATVHGPLGEVAGETGASGVPGAPGPAAALLVVGAVAAAGAVAPAVADQGAPGTGGRR